MPIIYSLVARGRTILVDYTESTGNFQQVTATILDRIPENDTKCTYVSGRYVGRLGIVWLHRKHYRK